MQQMNGGRLEGGGEGSWLKRGTKRDANDSNLSSDFERFEKRLRMLSLRASDSKRNAPKPTLYTPIPAEAASHSATHSPRHGNGPSHPQVGNDHMQVEDTPDRIYIHDLDAELAELDNDDTGDARLIFLPDIEKHFSKLPAQVLAAGGDDDGNRELVLYDVPRSLTVDEGHDSVRKAILESRQRARDKAVEESRRAHIEATPSHAIERAYEPAAHDRGDAEAHAGLDPDPDAMDLG